jgi:4,5-dihydroxyphthalate decarboxylase
MPLSSIREIPATLFCGSPAAFQKSIYVVIFHRETARREAPAGSDMADIHLTLASKAYDHFQDLKSGAVKPEGIALTCLELYPTDVFHRQLAFREFEVSEMSLCKHVAMTAEGRSEFVGIPVFPLRMFRQSAFYVRRDGPVKAPRDIGGRRCGVPEWAQTATVYARGWLHHHCGVPLDSVEWVQAGSNEAGRAEKVDLALPQGVRLRGVPDRSLNELLLAGDIDVAISATPLAASHGADAPIVRLFPNARQAEEEYFRATGVFPIMHTVVIRRDVHERHPWAAMNLMQAFEESKRRSVERLAQASPRFPLAWGPDHIRRTGQFLFGDGEYWPYGLEPNRVTLDAFLAYCHEQGITRRRVAAEELFTPHVLTRTKH